jgi:hypothetical protein
MICACAPDHRNKQQKVGRTRKYYQISIPREVVGVQNISPSFILVEVARSKDSSYCYLNFFSMCVTVNFKIRYLLAIPYKPRPIPYRPAQSRYDDRFEWGLIHSSSDKFRILFVLVLK